MQVHLTKFPMNLVAHLLLQMTSHSYAARPQNSHNVCLWMPIKTNKNYIFSSLATKRVGQLFAQLLSIDKTNEQKAPPQKKTKKQQPQNKT